MERAGIYVHIPFCRAKCPYCDFFSLPQKEPPWRDYLDALKQELLLRKEDLTGLSFQTLYVGGGTPSLFPPHFYEEWLDFLAKHLDLELKERTIEVNPEGLSLGSLKALRRIFNRLSIGAQSFSEKGLNTLRRRHNVEDILKVIDWASEASFENISLDLIFAWPGQTLKDLEDELKKIFSLPVVHLSFYELTIEPGTPFYSLYEKGALQKPSEEDITQMFLLLWERTKAAGFGHYEVSNYARPGYQCAHNILYWTSAPFVGFGPGAASFLHQVRRKNKEDLQAYLEALKEKRRPPEELDVLDPEARFREAIVLGLRLVQGVRRSAFKKRFGFDLAQYYGPLLAKLASQGLVSWDGENLKLTPHGRLLANFVARELI